MVRQCNDYLWDKADLLSGSLQDICMHVTKDYRFKACPASTYKHQAYIGGLVVHTAEVLELALRMSVTECLRANVNVVIVSAIVHDYGKIYDYDVVDGKAQYTGHHKTIRHVARSYAEFMILAKTYSLSESFIDSIGHCILAHHGRKEWGSPIEPESTEAHILHFADMLSAKCAEENYHHEIM